MIVKKSSGKVIGAQLTNAEKKAMDIEITKAIADYNRKNFDEIDAIFLWYLHAKHGFDYDQLKDTYFHLASEIEALADRYEMTGTGDRVWLCTYKLKDRLGIDLNEWHKELKGD